MAEDFVFSTSSLSTLIKDKLFRYDTTIDQIKTVAGQRLLNGELLRPRLDLFRLEKPICSLVFPEIAPEDLSVLWSKACFASSIFGATHVVFSHKATIGIENKLTGVETAHECLCIYFSSLYEFHTAIYPYELLLGYEAVSWQDRYDGVNPILEHFPLRVFLSLSTLYRSNVASVPHYLAWMRANGFEFEFHEPFTETNIGYRVS